MAFQFIWCWLVQARAAIPLLELCFFTAFLCSLRSYWFPQCTHTHSPGTVLHRQHLFSSCLQRAAASLALGHFWGSDGTSGPVDSLHSQRSACLFKPLAESRDVREEQQLGGCLAGLGEVGRCESASKVSLDQSLRIPIGPKYLSQVFDLLPLRAAITHLLSSVP